MKIQIRTAKVKLTRAERSQVELQLGLALGRFGDRIHHVLGHLRTESVGRGQEVRCRVDVDLRPSKISVEDGDVSPLLAVRRAAVLIARSVARALEQERRLQHPLANGLLGAKVLRNSRASSARA
jgi:ribosome-associated translation inhibitor RaiA